jgi:hypothetical protein
MMHGSVTELPTPPTRKTAPVADPNYYLLHLKSILADLYKAKPSSPDLLSSLTAYILKVIGSAPSTPVLSDRQLEALGNAIVNIRDVFSLSSDGQAKRLGEKFLSAYDLLATGCLTNSVDLVRQGIAEVNGLRIPDAARTAFLYIQCGTDTKNLDLETFGLLGYASKNNYIQIVEVLLKAGISANTTILRVNKPVFFNVVINTFTYQDFTRYGESHLRSILAPFQLMRDHVRLYLENGFDIATLYDGRNILEYANAIAPSNAKYTVYLIAKMIAQMFNANMKLGRQASEIFTEKFKRFCEKLSLSGQLKLFPQLAELYTKVGNLSHPVYRNANERNFYQLKYLLTSLLNFCSYELIRIRRSLLAFVDITDKQKELEDAVKWLQNFESVNFNLGPEGCWRKHTDLIIELADKISELETIFNINRFSISSTTPTLAAEDWEIFCEDNKAEITAVQNIANGKINVSSNATIEPPRRIRG